jgi:hypothetical protein
MDNLKWNLQLSSPLHFINPPLNPAMEIICPKNQEKLLASAFLHSVKCLWQV